MDPISASTLAIASIATSAVGAGVSAFGSMQSAQAQSAAAKYQAQVAFLNQQVQQQNAAYERQKGDVDAQAQDMKNKARLGAIDAAEGASGFDLSSGSSVDTRDSAARLGRLDTLTVRSNAERRAQDFDVAAIGQGAQGNLDLMKAKSAMSAGRIGVATSILGGVSSVADKWSSFTTKGVFGGASKAAPTYDFAGIY